MARRATTRGDNVLFTATSFSTAGDYTFCAWVKGDHGAGQNTGIYEDVLCWGNPDGGSYCSFVWDHDAGDYAHAVVQQGEDSTWTPASVGSLHANHWYHVLALFNAASRTLSGYRNGRRVTEAQSAMTSSGSYGVVRVFGPNADSPVGISAAEVAYWDRCLEPAEIAALAGYHRPSEIASRLQFYAPLSGTLDPELDLGPHGFEGTLTGVVSDTHPTLDIPTPNPALMPRPLATSPGNRRYCMDDGGRGVFLGGSHHWYTLQMDDFGGPPVDWDDYVTTLASLGHNCIRLWGVEPYVAGEAVPGKYLRTGPGAAIDGGPKYDLDTFNATYFDRLRARCVDAGNHGLYAIVMLWNGWALKDNGEGNPFPNHPTNSGNNINGIDGDFYDADGEGTETQEVRAGTTAGSLYAMQTRYLERVVDTVGDLPNVLYEITNESEATDANSAWQAAMVTHLGSYQSTKPWPPRLVGQTTQIPNGAGPDAVLDASSASWVSYGNGAVYGSQDLPEMGDTKVVLADTDHVLVVSSGQTWWPWKTLCRGAGGLLLMDDLLDAAAGTLTDASVRQSIGQAIRWANRMDLMGTRPMPETVSTSYALVNSRMSYLFYQPSAGGFTATVPAGRYRYEWFRPTSGAVVEAGTITMHGAEQALTPPFAGEASALLLERNEAGFRNRRVVTHGLRMN